jgi:metal-dependent amidase/aminoacylase/carboxypeptidase family protein
LTWASIAGPTEQIWREPLVHTVGHDGDMAAAMLAAEILDFARMSD